MSGVIKTAGQEKGKQIPNKDRKNAQKSGKKKHNPGYH